MSIVYGSKWSHIADLLFAILYAQCLCCSHFVFVFIEAGLCMQFHASMLQAICKEPIAYVAALQGFT